MTPQDVLRQAADLIERTGWCQGDIYELGENGILGYCAEGAIREVADKSGERFDIRDLLALAETGTDGDALYVWNDTPGRTKEEVIATLRRAAEMA